MPKWITTNWYSVDYGCEMPEAWDNHHLNRLTTPQENLEDRLNSLVTALNRDQFEIKAVVPKTLGLGNPAAGNGHGGGFGLTSIVGFVVC